MSPSVRASLAGLAAILLWSLLALMTAVSGALPPFQLLALSFAIGGLFGALLLLRRGQLRQALRQPPKAAVLATAALFGYHALYFFALKSAPVVEANLINYLWPLLIVVFAALITGQSVRPGQWLGTVLGLCAALLVVTRGRSIDLNVAHLSGYLAALGAALTWAAYSVLNRRFAAIDSAAIVGPCLLTALLGAIAHLALEQSVNPTLTQWLIILAMGVGPVGGAFWLWDLGTKRGDLVMLGTLSYLAPLLSTLWLVAFGFSEPHGSQAIAVVLLLLGGWLSRAQRPSREPLTAAEPR